MQQQQLDLWTVDLFAYALASSMLFVSIGLLYGLYLYVEIDAMRLGFFILIVSVAASLWQIACSYNKYPPPRQATAVVTSYSAVDFTWNDKHTGSSYQISPDGKKTPLIGNGLPVIEDKPKKRGGKKVIPYVVKLTMSLIRVFYGADDKRFTLVNKTVVDYTDEAKRPLCSSEFIAHKHNGDDSKLRYPYELPLDRQDQALFPTINNDYKTKPCLITIREDREYSTGHRTVQKMKIERSHQLLCK